MKSWFLLLFSLSLVGIVLLTVIVLVAVGTVLVVVLAGLLAAVVFCLTVVTTVLPPWTRTCCTCCCCKDKYLDTCTTKGNTIFGIKNSSLQSITLAIPRALYLTHPHNSGRCGSCIDWSVNYSCGCCSSRCNSPNRPRSCRSSRPGDRHLK